MRSKDMIIRAWKDPAYRAGLSEEERAALPESPAGQSLAELGEVALELAVGGGGPGNTSRVRCPPPKTRGLSCEDRFTLNRHACWSDAL